MQPQRRRHCGQVHLEVTPCINKVQGNVCRRCRLPLITHAHDIVDEILETLNNSLLDCLLSCSFDNHEAELYIVDHTTIYYTST